MMRAPIRVPITDPEPPMRLVPPITTAAIASSSYMMPAIGWAELSRATRRSAVTALSSPAMP